MQKNIHTCAERCATNETRFNKITRQTETVSSLLKGRQKDIMTAKIEVKQFTKHFDLMPKYTKTTEGRQQCIKMDANEVKTILTEIKDISQNTS